MADVDLDTYFLQLAERVGSSIVDLHAPHYEAATADAIRHFAHSYGDDNPLFSDRRYATQAAHGGLIAPPLFPLATGTPARPGHDDVMLERLPGFAHRMVRADTWYLLRPIPIDCRLDRRRQLTAVSPVDTGDERSWIVTTRDEYCSSELPHAVRIRAFEVSPTDHHIARTERTAPAYTDDDLLRIDRQIALQRRTGPTEPSPSTVGSVIGPLVKGPLTLTDLITYRGGVGPGPMGAAALELAHRSRREHPQLYNETTIGTFDTVERNHWDREYARSRGHVDAYDYTHTRLVWLSQLLTDWVGDSGWIWSIESTNTAFNYVGDTHWLRGVITAERRSGSLRLLELELEAENQLGAITTTGKARVALPADPTETFIDRTELISIPIPGENDEETL